MDGGGHLLQGRGGRWQGQQVALLRHVGPRGRPTPEVINGCWQGGPGPAGQTSRVGGWDGGGPGGQQGCWCPSVPGTAPQGRPPTRACPPLPTCKHTKVGLCAWMTAPMAAMRACRWTSSLNHTCRARMSHQVQWEEGGGDVMRHVPEPAGRQVPGRGAGKQCVRRERNHKRCVRASAAWDWAVNSHGSMPTVRQACSTFDVPSVASAQNSRGWVRAGGPPTLGATCQKTAGVR